MSILSQSRKSCPQKRKKKIQPSTALKTTQHMKKRLPSFPPSQGLVVHERPNPLTADGDKEMPLSDSTALLLKVGAHQQRGHWPRPSVESLTGTWKWNLHRPETFLRLSNPLQSGVTWDRSWYIAQTPGNGWTQSGADRRAQSSWEKLLARSYVWRTWQMVQENLLTEDDSISFWSQKL